jgi:hypothetical protein
MGWEQNGLSCAAPRPTGSPLTGQHQSVLPLTGSSCLYQPHQEHGYANPSKVADPFMLASIPSKQDESDSYPKENPHAIHVARNLL